MPFKAILLIPVVISLVFFNCHSVERQSQPAITAIDSLGKYSYLSCVYKDSLGQLHLQGITTGFFIRDSGVLYFGSSYHAMTQTVTTGGPVTGIIRDYMRVRLPDNGRTGYWQIDLRPFKERGHPILFTKYPDVYFIKCPPDLNQVHINSLEEFVKKSDDLADTAVSFWAHGYANPADLNIPINLDTFNHSFYSAVAVSPGRYAAIPRFQGIDSLNRVITPMVSNGFSGTPLFYSRADKTSGQQVLGFAGVIDARDTLTNYASFVKKQFVLQELEKAKGRP